MSETIVVDARKLADGGIGTYIQNMVEGMLALRSADILDAKLCLLIPEASMLCSRAGAFLSRISWEVECVEERAAKYSAAEYLLLPLRQRALCKSAALFHSPHYTLPFGLSIPSVVTIHDILHLTHEPNPLKRFIARQLIGSALNRANAVITVSARSKELLSAAFPGRSSTTMTVVHNAIRAVTPCPEIAAEEKSYLLWVGNTKPHKQLDVFLDALELAKTQGRALNFVVVAAIKDSTLAERIAALGGRVCAEVSDATLESLYRHADAVVMSSLEEGCGLPALEALAFGVPVVSTPIVSLREQTPTGIYYAEGFDAASLARAIEGFYLQPAEGVRRGARVAAERLQEYSLAIQAQRICAVYDRVLSSLGEKGLLVAPSIGARQRRLG